MGGFWVTEQIIWASDCSISTHLAGLLADVRIGQEFLVHAPCSPPETSLYTLGQAPTLRTASSISSNSSSTELLAIIECLVLGLTEPASSVGSESTLLPIGIWGFHSSLSPRPTGPPSLCMYATPGFLLVWVCKCAPLTIQVHSPRLSQKSLWSRHIWILTSNSLIPLCLKALIMLCAF